MESNFHLALKSTPKQVHVVFATDPAALMIASTNVNHVNQKHQQQKYIPVYSVLFLYTRILSTIINNKYSLEIIFTKHLA